MQFVEKNFFESYSLLEEKKWYGIHIMAIAEMVIFLFAFLLWDFFFGAGDRMTGTMTHPLWLVILLMTVQYGTPEGLIAVGLSTLTLYVGNIPEQYIDESYFEYQFRLYKLPFLWLFATLLVGELQGRKTRIYEELKAKYVQSELREKEIARAYEMLKVTKERLEGRLAGQLRSSIATYQALKSLEETKPAKVLLGLEGIVRTIMDPKKFSVYALGHTGLEASINVGWQEGDKYQRRFPQDSELYLNIVGKQQVLCALRSNEAKILNKEGILAAPLIDENSKAIFGMLKIEELDVEELNLSNIESFRLICESAGVAYANAVSYQRMIRNSIEDPRFPVLSPQFMSRQASYLMQLSQAVDLPLASLRVTFDKERIDKDRVYQTVELLKHTAQTVFGPLAELFFMRGLSFVILIPFIQRKTLLFSQEMLKRELEALEWLPINAFDMHIDWLHHVEEEMV